VYAGTAPLPETSNMILRHRILLLAVVVIIPAVSDAQFYQPYLFRTLAGTSSAGHADGDVTRASFNSPRGVAVDTSGNIFIADAQNLSIRKILPYGLVTTISNGASEFNVPTGIAVDNSGNVYVSDLGTSVIYKLMPDGTPAVFAGSRYQSGSSDGQGSAARFLFPAGMATDSSGNIYVADTDNCTIRKITPAGVVSTIAGSPGVAGSFDGTGSSATFRGPTGVALDQSGNVYVADTGNATVRKIAPNGVVSTIAGRPMVSGATDGAGAQALFSGPRGIAVDSTGNIYVTDTNSNNTVRRITPAGIVTTLAGVAGAAGFANGMASVAMFNLPNGLAVDSTGTLYLADSNNNSIRVSSPGPIAQMANISTRGVVRDGDNALIGGFISIGAVSPTVIFRAIGPSLAASGVQGALADPVLELHDASGALIKTNDNWKTDDATGGSQESYIRSIGLAPSSDAESVLVPTVDRFHPPLSPNTPYTVIVRGKNGTSGIALVEAYDTALSSGAIFGNLSTRGFVDADNGALIGGVIIGNQNGPTNILARAIGPSLSAAGVTNPLSDPTLELHDANGALVDSNDNWQERDATAIQATGIPPSDKRESALLKTLTPGNYTFVVRGKNGATGVGLVEIYNLQQ
jgi:sugar lactone lactonase YvrE